jgi:hypothetical protein
MYWSAAFWTMGRTVVDPLSLIDCLVPEATGAAVVTTGAGVDTGAVVASVATTVGDAVGAVVAAGAGVPLEVQPATNASMATARKQSVIFMNEFHLVLMVFNHPFCGSYKRFFRHKLY